MTHDDDFIRLHEDWRTRPEMLRSLAIHAGILVVPAFPIWDAERTATEIVAFTARDLPLPGYLYEWRQNDWGRR